MIDDDKRNLPTGAPDLDALRLPQDFAANLGVKNVLVHVSVKKPHKHSFIRVRPGNEWRMPVALIQLKEVNETYVVVPHLAANLPQDVDSYPLVTAIDRNGVVFLWSLRLGDDPWALSALAASKKAEESWVRVTANMSAGAYHMEVATGAIPEPEWPEESFAQLFNLAFRDRVIKSLEHPVIQRLKGAA